MGMSACLSLFSLLAGAQASDSLPIDGSYIFKSASITAKLRIEKRRAYIKINDQKEQEELYDIRPSGSEYVASPTRAVGAFRNTVTKITVLSPTKIRIKAWMGMYTDYTRIGAPLASEATVVSVTLNQQMISKVIKELPIVSVPHGTDHSYTESVTVHHSVDISKEWSVDSRARAAVWAIWGRAEAEIKARIANSTHTSYAETTTYSPSIVLRGTDYPASNYRVFVVQYYRTGVAHIRVSGQEKYVPYELADMCDLKAEKVR